MYIILFTLDTTFSSNFQNRLIQISVKCYDNAEKVCL